MVGCYPYGLSLASEVSKWVGEIVRQALVKMGF